MKFLLSNLFVSLMLLATVTGYPQNIKQKLRPEDQQSDLSSSDTKATEDNDDMYMEAMEQSSVVQDPKSGSQTFYPSFAPFHDPPLGHSRPFYYQQEGAYSHKPVYQQQLDYDATNTRFSGYKDDSYSEPAEANSLLGSGNFIVLKGGTFYDDSDEQSSYSQNYNYYQNGHGRPSPYLKNGNPQPQQYQQFENFRDFADINTPSNPEYSQFVVVYVNKNDTADHMVVKPSIAPKNIIERLAMLDLESSTTRTTETVPTKKLSISKRKLSLVLPEKKLKRKDLLKSKTTTPRDLLEPLLALS